MHKARSLEEIWLLLDEDKRLPPPRLLIALDPGGTTGAAVFRGFQLEQVHQLETGDMELAPVELDAFFAYYMERFDGLKEDMRIVIEDYKVYAQRSRQHVGSSLHTPRVIGCIETLVKMRGLPTVVKQGAGLAKGFATDDRLRTMGLYEKTVGKKHARDAVRHGVHFILWPSNPTIQRTKPKNRVG